MLRHLHPQAQKLTDDVIVTNKSPPVDSAPISDASLLKIPPPRWHQSIKAHRFNPYPETVRRNALSAIPIENCDDLLKIRSLRQYIPLVHDKANKPSIITINVSGDRFQTHLSTLQLYPDTLLGNENKRKRFWNAETKEYFFDRHRACFEAILYYYQSHGRLRRPEFVPLDTFLEEISFFELGTEATTQVRQVENVNDVKSSAMPQERWRWWLWYYLEYPQYSLLARTINLISIFFTIVSSIALAVESLPKYSNHSSNICRAKANIPLNATYTPRCSALFTSPFFLIQTICVLYFTIEFILRLISTPSYLRFLLSFFTWIDLGAIVPYFVFLSIQLANSHIGLDTSAILFIRILRILRFSRIVRIYLVFQQLKSLRVLSATMKESMVDFAVMIITLTLLAFLFGAATYSAEQQTNGDIFDSIPKAVYWGIITITGVGYGDMTPITAVGRVLTCICALLGPATIGVLTSVLVDRYQRVYNRKMYVFEPEAPFIDFDGRSEADEEAKSNLSSQRLGGRRNLSTIFNQQLASFQEKIKGDRNQSSKLQFVVSFNNDNTDDHATNDVLTKMKRKLTEVVSTTDVSVKLKLMDNDNHELWAISSSDLDNISIPTIRLTKNFDDDDDNNHELWGESSSEFDTRPIPTFTFTKTSDDNSQNNEGLTIEIF